MMNIVKEKHLGSGAYGAVYRVIDKNNDNHVVALKRMFNSGGDEEDKIDIKMNTIREFNYMQLLKHPNLVNTDPLVYNDGTKHAVFVNEEKHAVELSMELLNGDLYSLLDDKVTSEILNKMVCDVTNGLYHMHSMGFTHNDLKPENILYKCVDGVYTFKIADFGLSQYLGIPIPAGFTSFLCTATVKAPNSTYPTKTHIESNKYNYNSDMFSLGATMFWLYSKQNNYRWSDFMEIDGFLDNRKEIFLLQVDNLKKMYGEDGFDFLMKCLQPEAPKRMSSKQALNHPYINKLQGGGVMSKIFNRIVKLYKEPTIEELAESKYELEYLEDMYNKYKGKRVNLYIDFSKQTGNFNQGMIPVITDWLYGTYAYFNFNTLEIFLQTQLNLKSLINKKTNLTKSNADIYSLSVLRLCDKLYCDMEGSEISLYNYFVLSTSSEKTVKTMSDTEKDILKCFDYQIPFVPVMFFLNYWYLNSVYSHPSKEPNMKILTTGVVLMIAILSSNLPILEDVKMDDLAKYCIHKAIQLKNYTKKANVCMLKVDEELQSGLDEFIKEFCLTGFSETNLVMFQKIILDKLDQSEEEFERHNSI